MPVQDWNLKATFDGAYTLHGEDHRPHTRDWVKLHYHREVIRPFIQAQVTGLIAALTLETTQSIVIVGGAFGWSVEELLSRDWKLKDIAVTDTSTYVQDSKGGTEEVEINAAITLAGLDPGAAKGLAIKTKHFDGGARVRLGIIIHDEDLLLPSSTKAVRQAAGATGNNKVDWCISEEVITNLEDADVVAMLEGMDDVGTNVAHLTSALSQNQDPDYNWKTMADWRTFLNSNGFSAHTLVEQGTFEVF